MLKLWWLILCLFIPISVFAYSDHNSTSILKYFQNEIQSQSPQVCFEILPTTYAKLNFLGKFADGKYKLQTYKIKPIADNVYQLILQVSKRKKLVSFGQKIVLYFWQGRNKLVFLTSLEKKQVFLPKPSVLLKKLPDGSYLLEQKLQVKEVTLKVRGGKLHLFLRPIN